MLYFKIIDRRCFGTQKVTFPLGVTKIDTHVEILRGILETTIAEGKLGGKILTSVQKK